MRKADRSNISHTINSFWKRKQPVIKGVLLSVAYCHRDAGALVRGFGVVAIFHRSIWRHCV